MSDPGELARRYDQDKLPIFLEIQKIFTNYEIEVRKLLKKTGVAFSTFQYQIKSWFFNRLAGKEIANTEERLSSEVIKDVNNLLDRIIMNNPDTIGAYIEILKKSLDKVTFLRNKPPIEAIITNLLELLAKLRQRCVAMRDLKPDNLLVAGDRNRYPKFLSDPEQYTIGLIDVETAVVLGTSTNMNIDQPLLGGTPQYATPSHFLKNDTLASTFGDLPTIFYLQDWHAIIVMIYKLITGEFLFQQTSQTLPEILQIIQTSLAVAERKTDIVEHVSNLFWSKAAAEFKMKLAEHAEVLDAVKITLPDVTNRMVSEYIEKEKQNIAIRIGEQVNSQNMFTSAKNRQYLSSCSGQEISKLKQKWEKANGVQEAVVADRGEIQNFLRSLEELKLKLEQLDQKAVLLQREESVMSGYELLELLFGVVLTNMCDEHWSESLPADLTGFDSAHGDVSGQATI
jgi:serine/threonine protein kinase